MFGKAIRCNIFTPLQRHDTWYWHDILYIVLWMNEVLAGHHIVIQISIKLGMVDGCRMGSVIVNESSLSIDRSCSSLVLLVKII